MERHHWKDFIGMADAKAETPILWLPDAKSQLIRKHSDARKDWRQEEKGVTEDEMVGWQHWHDGHELGVGDGQGSLACCSPCGLKESDTTKQLNWTENEWHCKLSDPIYMAGPSQGPSVVIPISHHIQAPITYGEYLSPSCLVSGLAVWPTCSKNPLWFSHGVP